MTTKNKLKIVFMGTPQFAVPILDALISDYDVVLVVTQPDKKVGRKQEVTYSPIKKLALKNKIDIFQPAKIDSDFIKQIKRFNPDFIVIAAYGFILPQEILDIPQYGAINVHTSLLPKYRGASPIHSAILNGDKKTGVTIMLINEKMDQGDILSQAKINIDNNETFSTLHDKLAVLGADLLIDTLSKYIAGEIKPQKQDESKATYCRLITKDDGKIDWSQPAEKIEQQVRAFYPWPGTWTVWNGKKLKISSVMVSQVEPSIDTSTKLPPSQELGRTGRVTTSGEVFKDNEYLSVKCGQGALVINKLQLEGKKEMTGQEFLNGHSDIVGSVLK